jgi:ABC-2 type transport system permease protein
MWRALGAIIERDLKRMLRQRGRLVSAMVRPLIWRVSIGGGMQTMVEQGNPGLRYKEFMVPGLLSMVLLFGSLLASLSMVYDKEGGVMRMLLMAPFPRYWIILARSSKG